MASRPLRTRSEAEWIELQDKRARFVAEAMVARVGGRACVEARPDA